MCLFVLVGGWPAAGKSTLARALAEELAIPCLSKDAVKESLMDALGAPTTVEESRRLGEAAVRALLGLARECRDGAVIDSTWFAYTRPLVLGLPGSVVEVRCRTDLETVRQRHRGRVRDPRHLDDARTEDELWATEVPPLGVGPLVEVDTTDPVDVRALADRVRAAILSR
jgi:predicted kinase